MLWPAITALVAIFITKNALLGLFAGAISGTILLNQGNLFLATTSLIEDHFFPSFQGSWRIGALLFTLILGSFSLVIERGGGFQALANKLIQRKRGSAKRNLEIATGSLGLLCFFDGLANSLLLGRISQPMADRVGVARARMAYLVDSTSSSVACIAFISTWIATQLSLIQQSIEGRGIQHSAYSLYFQSIPANFYCCFTLILVAVVIWRNWNIGPMKKAKVYPPSEAEQSDGAHPSIWISLAPILVLSSCILTLFYIWDTTPLFPITQEKLTAAFSGKAGPYALTLGSLIGLFAACCLFPKNRKNQLSTLVTEGAAHMLSPLLILVMAWTFGSIITQLGTSEWIANSLASSFPLEYFPAAIFFTGSIMSFFTGSSWATMALLMPIAIPSYLDIAGDAPLLLPAVIGAVFSGAVFGDHCSPFSDTTIVSAFACGVSPQEHVITQLPYALIAAFTALLFGYFGLALGVPASLTLVLGSVFLIGLAIINTRPKSPL